MNSLIDRLRQIHGVIHEWIINVLPLYIERFYNPKSVYLAMTPEHGNLGDHAIAQSEISLLNELKIPFIELTDRKLIKIKENNGLSVMNGRTILVHGGGFLGTIWPNMEMLLRDIVKSNPKSRIILFPNTVYYENSDSGLAEFEESKRVYNHHKYLKIYAREKTSYHLMKKAYNSVSVAPDMVFLMNKSVMEIDRKGCILCLRNDRERTRSDKGDDIINSFVKNLFGDSINMLDMVVPYSVSAENREKELEKQFNSFKNVKLVVTDRLHGMIFSVITGTPCIVIDSKSPKIRGCYEWVKDLPYVKFCEDIREIELVYRSIPVCHWEYNTINLLHNYDDLIHDIIMSAKR